MTAGPEHDHHAQSGQTGLRAAWQGSRRFAVMAGVVTLGVLAGAGVAVAATSSSGQPAAPAASASPAPSPSHVRPQFPAKGPWRMLPPGGAPFLFGPGLGLGVPFGAIHGTVVVPKPGGGYRTMVFQNGKVTAVSSTSITLRSADGYSRSYQVTGSTIVNAQRDGIGSIKAGNQVMVTATLSGSTATAVRVIDVSLIQRGFHRFFGAAPRASVKMAIP